MNSESDLKEILTSAKTIASVGLSTNPEKDSYRVVSYLKEQGYRVIPVNPTATEIFGEKAYPDLVSVPEQVDIVQTADIDVAVLNDNARKLIRKFLPGPLTVMLTKKPNLPDMLTSGSNQIGIRIPDHPFALRLIQVRADNGNERQPTFPAGSDRQLDPAQGFEELRKDMRRLWQDQALDAIDHRRRVGRGGRHHQEGRDLPGGD